MTPTIRNLDKLIDALESEDYQQGRLWLRISSHGKDFYSMMGVACDVYAQEHSNVTWKLATTKEISPYTFQVDEDSLRCFETLPPEEVIDWYGIDTTDMDTYLELNDSLTISFMDLAARLRDFRLTLLYPQN